MNSEFSLWNFLLHLLVLGQHSLHRIQFGHFVRFTLIIMQKKNLFQFLRQSLIKFVQVDTMELKALYMSLDVIHESVDTMIQMTKHFVLSRRYWTKLLSLLYYTRCQATEAEWLSQKYMKSKKYSMITIAHRGSREAGKWNLDRQRNYELYI